MFCFGITEQHILRQTKHLIRRGTFPKIISCLSQIQRIAGKMIRTPTFSAVLACVSLLQGISGAAYSNVFVQSGADIVPVEYVKYGAPAVPITGSQIAQISAPVDSIVSLPSMPAVVSPCVAPCVIPGAPLSAVAPISSTANAKIVAYKSPIANVPVVLANKDEATSYQYAYFVNDESTGDKKAQSEQSDGSVVQGQYSFIQPDGYRREVFYTADDLKGFNAVVRNFLPDLDSKSVKKEEPKDDKKDLPPCKDVKSEQLNVEPKAEPPKAPAPEVEQLEVTEKPKEEVSQPPAEAKDGGSNPSANSVVSYDEILKCLQAKAQKNGPSSISPLTYILLPSLGGFGRPC